MSTQAYLDSVESHSRIYPRYQWLLSYLQRDQKFLRERIHPVALGHTRAIVADFFSNQSSPPSIIYPNNNESLERALAGRSDSAAVRLIFVVSISGVDEQARKRQLSTTYPGLELGNSVNRETFAPVVTRARAAGVLDSHPIMGHTSHLPEPAVLNRIAAATQLDAGILLQHLDQQEHLVYRRHAAKIQRSGATRKEETWVDISFGVDQANYVTAMVHTESDQTGKKPERHTILLLVNEDNCLGIDFNIYSSHLDRVLQSCGDPPHEAFKTMLHAKNEEEQSKILEEPLSLAWDYFALLSTSFSCQLELYRRRWDILYESYVNTSVVYGNADSRRQLRRESAQISVHLHYLRRSLQSLEQIKHEKLAMNPGASSYDFNLNTLVQDLQQMSIRLEALKSAYETFIKDQISKVSEKEARQSMTEARDLRRLSYLGFVFAPLSLATSFFSINIRPLGGEAPLWAFIATSLLILGASILTLLWLNHQAHKAMKRDVGKGMPSIATSPPRQQIRALPGNYTGLPTFDPEYAEHTQFSPPPNQEEFADRPYTSTIESQITRAPPLPRQQQQKRKTSPARRDSISSQISGSIDAINAIMPRSHVAPKRNVAAGRSYSPVRYSSAGAHGASSSSDSSVSSDSF